MLFELVLAICLTVAQLLMSRGTVAATAHMEQG